MRKPRQGDGRKKRNGVPPPPKFDLWALADSTVITQNEVGAVERRSITAIEKGRYSGTDGLDWIYVNGFPRCRVGSLKRKMAGDPTVRRPAVRQPKAASKVKASVLPSLRKPPVPRTRLLALRPGEPREDADAPRQTTPAERKLREPKVWLAKARKDHPQEQNERPAAYARRLYTLMQTADVTRVWSAKTLRRRLYDK